MKNEDTSDGYALALELIRGDGTADSLQRAIDMARALIAKVEAPPAPRIALIRWGGAYSTPGGEWEIRKASDRRWWIFRKKDGTTEKVDECGTLAKARESVAWMMRKEAAKAQPDAR